MGKHRLKRGETWVARTAGGHVPPERETQEIGRTRPLSRAKCTSQAPGRVSGSICFSRQTHSERPASTSNFSPGKQRADVQVPACLPAEAAPQGPPFHLLPCDGNRVQTDPTVPQPPLELHFFERSIRHFRQEGLLFSIVHILRATQTADYRLSL